MYDRAALPRQIHPRHHRRRHSKTRRAARCKPACHAATGRLATADLLMSDIGPLKLCRHCGEHWPADGEFFARDARRQDGL
ncbi:hypothetical protein ACU4GD_34445 [Cupriavidus basilensis]